MYSSNLKHNFYFVISNQFLSLRAHHQNAYMG